MIHQVRIVAILLRRKMIKKRMIRKRKRRNIRRNGKNMIHLVRIVAILILIHPVTMTMTMIVMRKALLIAQAQVQAQIQNIKEEKDLKNIRKNQNTRIPLRIPAPVENLQKPKLKKISS